MKRLCGIYTITHLPSGKVYIGSSVHIYDRWKVHRSRLSLGSHANPYLQSLFNKYEGQSFDFKIVEICDRENMLSSEQFWIDHAVSMGLAINLRRKAESNLGCVASEETKQKMSVSMSKWWSERPEKRQNFSDYMRARMSDPQEKAKKAEMMKLRWQDPDQRARMMSPEVRAARVRTRRGNESAKAAQIARNKEVLSKIYTIESPDGRFMTVRNMSAFCRGVGLSPDMMYGVASGRFDTHKGWTCRHATPEEIRTYELID